MGGRGGGWNGGGETERQRDRERGGKGRRRGGFRVLKFAANMSAFLFFHSIPFV